MPKNKVSTVPINKEFFKLSLKKRGYTIKSVCETGICSYKTLRRMLDAGRIRPQYLDAISKQLDLDPRFLSGQLHMGYEKVKAEETPNGNTARKNIEDFPYFRKIRDAAANEKLSSIIDRPLIAFDIDPEQYYSLPFDEQCTMAKEIIDALYNVYRSHFKKDGLGNKGLPAVQELDYIVECIRDNHEEEAYVEEVLRPKYIRNPPKGMTPYKIKKMPFWKLMDLDYAEQQTKTQADDETKSPFYEKYQSLFEDGRQQLENVNQGVGEK